MVEEKIKETKEEKPEEVPSSGGRYTRNRSGALEREEPAEPEPKPDEQKPQPEPKPSEPEPKI